MGELAPRSARPTVEPAEFQKDVFSCAACGVYSPHRWFQLHYTHRSTRPTHVWRCECDRCHAETYWFEDGRQIDPEGNAGPPPNADMSDEVRDDYLEAGAIVDRSPRGACALLRLATEKLLGDLGNPKHSLSQNINLLHGRGELPERVVKAMDVLRVVGNNAVHPLELDLRDDRETATSLFELVNLIVEHGITGERQIDEMFDRLPEGSKNAIAGRNALAQLPSGS